MAEYAKVFRAFATIGIGLEATGFLSNSIFVIPPLKTLSGQAAQVAFTRFLNVGLRWMAPISILSNVFLLLARYYSGPSAKIFGSASALDLLTTPFIVSSMTSTNNALLKGPVPSLSAANTQALLDKWSKLNTLRGLFPLIGFLAIIWDTFVL